MARLVGLDDTDAVISTSVLDEIGDAIGEFGFCLWDDGSPATGWTLRLAVEDRVAGVAWALGAFDASLQ